MKFCVTVLTEMIGLFVHTDDP